MNALTSSSIPLCADAFPTNKKLMVSDVLFLFSSRQVFNKFSSYFIAFTITYTSLCTKYPSRINSSIVCLEGDVTAATYLFDNVLKYFLKGIVNNAGLFPILVVGSNSQ